jgi:hypothetical protein
MSGPEFQVQAAHVGKVAKELGLPFLDLTPPLRAREAAGDHLYWQYDHHFRPPRLCVRRRPALRVVGGARKVNRAKS